MLKRWLGTDGWGAVMGTLLLLGFGLFVIFISAADLREAARTEPVERTCASWLADPSGARWIRLSGCRLDLAEAASRRWKGWRSVKDGGVVGARYLELFLPLYVGDQPPQKPRAVLATTEKPLLALMDGITALPLEQVDAYLQSHESEFRELLEPKTITGYVEPVKSIGANSALSFLTDEDAVVLEQGREPRRANSVFGLVVGLFCVALGVRSLGRRFMLERDSSL